MSRTCAMPLMLVLPCVCALRSCAHTRAVLFCVRLCSIAVRCARDHYALPRLLPLSSPVLCRCYRAPVVAATLCARKLNAICIAHTRCALSVRSPPPTSVLNRSALRLMLLHDIVCPQPLCSASVAPPLSLLCHAPLCRCFLFVMNRCALPLSVL